MVLFCGRGNSRIFDAQKIQGQKPPFLNVGLPLDGHPFYSCRILDFSEHGHFQPPRGLLGILSNPRRSPALLDFPEARKDLT